MEALNFIPLMITTLGLAIASFTAKKKKTFLIIAFIVWLLSFLYTIGVFYK